MATLNGLPVYNIRITEDLSNKTGVDFISLVDYPAIETNWVAMGDHKKPFKFSVSEDKQLLYGPILIPDMPIYRYDDEMGEYYVVFSAEEIQKIVRKFQASQKTVNLNYQHLKDSQLKQAVVQEIWLTGTKDKSQDLGFDLPANSAFVCTHIGDKDFWDKEIKTGNVRGFSIEGFLDMELKKLIKQKMGVQKFSEVKVMNDNSIFIDGEIAVGSMVYSNQPSLALINGVQSEIKNPVWECQITIADGRMLVLSNGKIIEILNTTKMSKIKLSAEAKTSDGKILKTTADAMAVGTDLLIVDESGTETPAPDGDYTLENGDVVTVLAGKITAITEMDLSSEEEAVIQEAVMKIVTPLITKMQTEIDELKTKLSNTPGAPSLTSNTDLPANPTKLSAKKTLAEKLSILRKKDSELPATKK